MGRRREQWAQIVAGTASAGLPRLADDSDALGGTAATPLSTRSFLSTRTKGAGQTSAIRTSSRTTANATGGVVAAASAREAFGRAPSSAVADGASQPSLWT